MPRPRPRHRLVATALTAPLLTLALVWSMLGTSPAPTGAAPQPSATDVRLAAGKPNPVTPGNFTGFGFDQCLAPSQRAMTTWMRTSPFLAVGIYIAGDSRGCRSQPNLTPAWIRTQLRQGWELLPITLGPQASCSPHFPRYGNDETISPARGSNGTYGRARKQGKREASTTVREAKRLGIVPGSTLWYDLEAFDIGNRDCRESALAFLSAWTTRLHALDYVSGVYSSAGSGIKMLDDARISRPRAFALPDMIWMARWDNQANTSSSYIRDDGWRPGGRIKQYQGGHDETWGGVRINIDRNWLDVGKGSVAPAENHCNGTDIDLRRYRSVDLADADGAAVEALQCLLSEQGFYKGRVDGRSRPSTMAAAQAWQSERGFATSETFGTRQWVSLLAHGDRQVLKFRSAGTTVRRLQRALYAAGDDYRVRRTGVFSPATQAAVRRYQQRHGLRVTSIVTGPVWKALARGRS